jgi:hypothetical protein
MERADGCGTKDEKIKLQKIYRKNCFFYKKQFEKILPLRYISLKSKKVEIFNKKTYSEGEIQSA